MTLFNLFEKIFTRSSKEEDINPLIDGKDFNLIVDVILEIAKGKGIDIWKDQNIVPLWSISQGEKVYNLPEIFQDDIKDYNQLIYEYDGNLTKENIFEYNPLTNSIRNNFDYHLVHSSSINDYSYVCWCNKVYNTKYTFDEYFNRPEGVFSLWKTQKKITKDYFCLTLYFIEIIDKWAHMFCSENTEVVSFKEDIPKYIWEKRLWYRVLNYNPRNKEDTCNGTIYFRGDFTEKTIPKELEICWKFFQEIESILEKFYKFE